MDRDIEKRIHERLLAGDPTASAEVAEQFLIPIVRSLKANYNNTDKDTIIDAAVDAILNYSQNPQSYNPSKCSLTTYLYMSAKGDLLNYIQKKKLRLAKEIISDLLYDNIL